MSVLEGPLVFVDIETNGLSYSHGRVIEVAAIRVEGGEIVSSLNHLINPGTDLSGFITNLTGITNKAVASAPAFEDIADELMQIMDGALFVAHNVRFDYSFIKHELGRAGKKFNPRLMCTVKLSRAMYPDQQGHKLQDLINRCDLQVENRHRAYDDALAMWQFVCHLKDKFPMELIDQAVSRQVKSPSLPKQISPSIIKSLPEGPGVYIFQDNTGSPLYIGKSVNIRKRVLSHFSSDHSSAAEFKISQGIANIETIETSGELHALLLESDLIKDKQPLYNRKLRRNQKLTIARKRMTDHGYLSITIEDTYAIDKEEVGDILAVYTTKGKAKKFLEEICKTYGLCPKLMGLEKGSGACFSYQIKKCRGGCVGQHSTKEYNDLMLDVFASQRLSEWPFKSPVLVQETTLDSEDYKSLVIDNWCIIADISQPENCAPTVKFYDRAFDIDTYRILKSFIDVKKHRLNIKPISIAHLQEIASINAY